jgi:hypothetical protein
MDVLTLPSLASTITVGEFGKNLIPSKRRVCWNSWGFQVMCENDSRIWLLRVNLLSISEWLKPAKLWNQEPAKHWNHEPAKHWNHELAKLRNRGSAKFGNLMKSKFGGYDVWRSSCIRDSETSKKSSQRRCLKSPGLTCELVASL